MNRTTEALHARPVRRRAIARVLTMTAILGLSGSLSIASASVLYTDIPDRNVEQSAFFLDVDGDGIRDLLFDHELGCVGNCLSNAMVGGVFGAEVLVTPGGLVTPLGSAASIGPGSATFGFGGLLAQDGFSGNPPVTGFENGLWDNGLTAFLGFRFLIGGNTHYAWARLNVAETTNVITLFDFAYESTPDTPIRTPAVPEPSSVLMLALGAVAAWRMRRN